MVAHTNIFTDELHLWGIYPRRDDNSCWVFIPSSLLGAQLSCLLSHGIVPALLILTILGATIHDSNVTVSLHFLFYMANHCVAFGHTNCFCSAVDVGHSSLTGYRCGSFFTWSALDIIMFLVGYLVSVFIPVHSWVIDFICAYALC